MKYSETLTLENIETLTLITVSADLKVEQTSREDLLYNVILKKDHPEYKPIVSRFNKSLEIRFQKKSNNIFLGFLDLRTPIVEKIYVEIPKNKNLNLIIKTVSGDTEIKNLSVNSFNFSGVSGELECDNINADKVSVSLVSGDVNFDGLKSRKIALHTVSGDGKINGIARTIQEISVSSVSGDIELGFEARKPSKMFIKSTSGEIRSNIPLHKLEKGVFVNYDINEEPDDILTIKASSISGDFQVNFGDSKNKITEDLYVLSDDEVQRVLRMIKNGILKREEGIEILKTIGYSEEEISEIVG